MTFKEFREKYLGKKIDWDGVYGGQCVDLFLQYNKEVIGNTTPKPVVGAKDYWTNYTGDKALNSAYTQVKNTPSGVPNEGDVVIWNKSPKNEFGHVAVFIEGDDKKFTSFDQNFPTLSKCTVTEHNYNYVLGWLKPINLSQPMIIKPSDKLPEPFYKINEAKELQKRKLITPKDAFDTILAKFVATSDVLEKQKETFDTETKALIEEKKVLNEKVEGITQDLNARNSYIRDLEAKVERLNSISNNIPTSASGDFNFKDLKNWLKTQGLFFGVSAILSVLIYIQPLIPQTSIYGVLALYIVGAIIDFIKKLLADNGGK